MSNIKDYLDWFKVCKHCIIYESQKDLAKGVAVCKRSSFDLFLFNNVGLGIHIVFGYRSVFHFACSLLFLTISFDYQGYVRLNAGLSTYLANKGYNPDKVIDALLFKGKKINNLINEYWNSQKDKDNE